MTWNDLTTAVNQKPFRDSALIPIATSTLRGIANKGSVNSTVVLQILRWPRRAPEEFVRDGSVAGRALPDDGLERLVVDTAALYEAIDHKRIALGHSWDEVASELGPRFNAGVLRSLRTKGTLGFPTGARIFQWSERPVADFVRFAGEEPR